MNLAQSTYKHSRTFFDAQAARLVRQVQVDGLSAYAQKTTLFTPHTNVRTYLLLLPVALIHVAKLIKNILLLVATAVLCLLALFSDRKIAAKLAMAMAAETFLIFANATNAVFALIAPFTTGLVSIPSLFVAKSDDESDDGLDIHAKKMLLAYDGILSEHQDVNNEMKIETDMSFDELYNNSFGC